MTLVLPGPQGSLWKPTTSESAWEILSQRILFKAIERKGRKWGGLAPLACCGCPERRKNGITAHREVSYGRPWWRGAEGRERVGNWVVGTAGSPRRRTIRGRHGELRHWDGRKWRDFSVEIPGLLWVLATVGRHLCSNLGGSLRKFCSYGLYASWC